MKCLTILLLVKVLLVLDRHVVVVLFVLRLVTVVMSRGTLLLRIVFLPVFLMISLVVTLWVTRLYGV